jgi:bacterial/archaeal transporter family-2 protein
VRPVSGGNALAVVLALSAGLAGSVQAAVMGKLGERVGIFEALAFSTVVAIVVGWVTLIVVRQGVGDVASAARAPVWLWTGGALSAFIVLAITVGPPRIGVTATVAMVIAGNLVMATLIDRFGWLGNERIDLNWSRVLGLLLLVAGAALTLRK